MTKNLETLTTQERLRLARQRKRRRRLLRLLVVLLVLAACTGLYVLLHQPWIQFGEIAVHGSQRITPEEIKVAAGIGKDEPVNLFRTSKSRLLSGLQNDVRVGDVRAEYKFPNRLDVYLQDRVGLLCVRCAYGGFVTVDKTGLILSTTNGIVDSTVPFFSGYRAGNVYVGDLVPDKPVTQVLRFLSGISAEAREQIAEVSLGTDNRVEVRLHYGFPVRLGPVEDLDEKSAIFMTVFGEIQGKHVRAAFIDLQYSKPYIKLLPEKPKQ